MTSADPDFLPPGGWVEIPGRGRAWVWDGGKRGDGPTVVLLHGWSSTAALNWQRCFAPLAGVARVVAMDHRGHGRGIPAKGGFRLETCADDIAGLIEHLGCAPAVVAGYSMGGPVAQLVWRRHPEVVRGLVLCATAADLHGRGGPPLARQILGAGLNFGVTAALCALPPAWVAEGRRRLVSTRPMAPWAEAEAGRGDPVAIAQAAACLAAYDASGWIGEVDRPTAVVVTAQDRTVAPARQWAMARAIPGARTLVVPGDHRACVEQADLFAPALLDAVAHAAA